MVTVVIFSLFFLSSHGAYTLKMCLLEETGAIGVGEARVSRASRDLTVKQPGDKRDFVCLCVLVFLP